MTSELTTVHEVGECRLVQHRRAEVHALTDSNASLHQRLWNDHVAQAQGRKQHRAERPHIDHSIIPVHPSEGSKRTSCIAKLAVVVVFDNPRVLSLSPLKKRKSAGRRHCDSKGELMRRSDICHPRSRAKPDQG